MARLLRSYPRYIARRRPLTRRIGTIQTITVSGILTEEAFGSHQITSGLFVAPSSIDSNEAFGTASINQSIQPSSISTSEALGTAALNQKIVFTGIPSSEVFGTAAIQTVFAIRPIGIPSEEVFGSTTVSQDIGIRYPLRVSVDDSQTRVLVDFR